MINSLIGLIPDVQRYEKRVFVIHFLPYTNFLILILWFITYNTHICTSYKPTQLLILAVVISVKHSKRGIVWSYLFLMGSFTFLFYYYHTILLFTTFLVRETCFFRNNNNNNIHDHRPDMNKKASRTSDTVRVKGA